MYRRDFMLVLAGAMTTAPTVRAQQKAMPVIGFLGVASPDLPLVALNLRSFWQGLREEGYFENQNVAAEYHWTENHYDRLPALAAELVHRKVDVIVNEGDRPSAQAARDATSTIPIVFHTSDAVEDGLVASLARPGGNLTGVSLFGYETYPKLFQLASELVPRAKVMGLLVNPNSPAIDELVRIGQQTTTALGVHFSVLKAGTDSELDTAFAKLGEARADLLVIPSDVFLNTHTDQVVALAARHAIPTISGQDRRFAASGGLLGFAPSLPAAYRIKGNYAGRILKGAKPADLPVQQPTTFELVVNLNTAKALGLSVPPSILARADEVIE